jgi:hypothetical protein
MLIVGSSRPKPARRSIWSMVFDLPPTPVDGKHYESWLDQRTGWRNSVTYTLRLVLATNMVQLVAICGASFLHRSITEFFILAFWFVGPWVSMVSVRGMLRALGEVHRPQLDAADPSAQLRAEKEALESEVEFLKAQVLDLVQAQKTNTKR